jgi:Membrane protein involved in the export of O-antigen and teichoic acid
VIQTLILVTILTVCYWYFAKWKPKLQFSFKPIGEMLRFSIRLLITNIFGIINDYVFSVILGRHYTETDVGHYTQANKWDNMGYSLIKGMVNSVAQPVLVEVVDERDRQLRVFRKMVRFIAFVSFPAMLGLAFISNEFITITITDKWAPSADILKVLCISGAFIPLSALFSNLVISKGRSSAYMWTTISLAVLILIVMMCIYPLGIMAMVTVYTIINILWLGVWFMLVRKEIGYRFTQLLADIVPFLGITILCIAAAHFMTARISNIYVLLISKVLIVALEYMFVLWISKSETFRECIEFVKKKIKK